MHFTRSFVAKYFFATLTSRCEDHIITSSLASFMPFVSSLHFHGFIRRLITSTLASSVPSVYFHQYHLCTSTTCTICVHARDHEEDATIPRSSVALPLLHVCTICGVHLYVKMPNNTTGYSRVSIGLQCT